jgi:ArsR family transcriptional regulator
MYIELAPEANVTVRDAQATAAVPAVDRVDLIFRALASRPRREILTILADAGRGSSACCSDVEVCACVFAERLGIGAPTVSHHMRALLDASLVTAEKRGQWVYYRLVPKAFAPVLDELGEFVSGASGCGEGTSA